MRQEQQDFRLGYPQRHTRRLCSGAEFHTATADSVQQQAADCSYQYRRRQLSYELIGTTCYKRRHRVLANLILLGSGAHAVEGSSGNNSKRVTYYGQITSVALSW